MKENKETNELRKTSYWASQYKQNNKPQQAEGNTPDNPQMIGSIQNDDLVLSIIQAEKDGEECSQYCIENEVFLAFYEREGRLHFVIASQKENWQIYGGVVELKQQKDEHSIAGEFLWKYSYNDSKETAIILMRLTPRNETVAFELSILTENALLMKAKGYVNGSLNWKGI